MADNHEFKQMLRLLIEYRETQGMTPSDVARKMNLTTAAVCRLESGELDPRLSMLTGYARAVGVSLTMGLRPRPRAGVR